MHKFLVLAFNSFGDILKVSFLLEEPQEVLETYFCFCKFVSGLSSTDSSGDVCIVKVPPYDCFEEGD